MSNIPFDSNKFYNCTNDAAFKAVFSDEKDFSLLEFLISKSLEQKVRVLRILNPGIVKTNVAVKGKTLDVLVELEDGSKANIELNNAYYAGLHERNAAYIFAKYSEDAKVSEDYSKMNKHYQINITAELPKEDPEKMTYMFSCREFDINFVDNIIIYEYNLDKIIDQVTTSEDKYSFIAMLGAGKKELEKVNLDPDYIEFLSYEEDAKKVHNTLVNNANAEGIEQGIEIGAKQEKIEGKQEIAKNMLSKKFDIKDIAEITGLSVEEIEALK